MTRTDLELLKDAEKRIFAKKLELEALRYKASGAGAIRYDKDSVQTSPQDYLTLAIADIVELEKQIAEDEIALEDLKGKTYSVIRKIENPEYRALLEWYYLNDRPILEIANKLNVSERTAYYLRDDALEAFEMIP